MKTKIKPILQVIAWGALGLAGLFIILAGSLSLRHSFEYMKREYFMDFGNVYDFRLFPERKLTASPDPFQFAEDASREAEIQDVFQSNPKIANLDKFLEDTGTQAFLVIQDDTILYERYFLDHKRDSLVTSVSIAKSFDSAMVGIAIADGFIKNAQDPITDYIPELTERDPRFEEIQIRHLLMNASGLGYEPDRPFGFGDGSLTYAFDDLRHLALTETEVVEAPGANFVYNNFNPLLLGIILERATGKTVTAFLQEKIWTPIGMEYDGSWSMDSEKSGFEKMESGLNARAIDFAKLGRLYLHDGNWDGTQVVPEEWVAESTRDGGLIQDAPIYYGYMWWGRKCDSNSHDFFALGDYGQFVYVSTAKDLIIVRNGERYGLDGEFVEWTEVFCQFEKAMPANR